MPARSVRYSAWDGSQHIDFPDADDVLEAISDDLMNYGDLQAALQRLYRWGNDRMPGLDQLLEHLQRQMAQMQSLLRSLSPEARA